MATNTQETATSETEEKKRTRHGRYTPLVKLTVSYFHGIKDEDGKWETEPSLTGKAIEKARESVETAWHSFLTERGLIVRQREREFSEGSQRQPDPLATSYAIETQASLARLQKDGTESLTEAEQKAFDSIMANGSQVNSVKAQIAKRASLFGEEVKVGDVSDAEVRKYLIAGIRERRRALGKTSAV
jgi:hypothetical protein